MPRNRGGRASSADAEGARSAGGQDGGSHAEDEACPDTACGGDGNFRSRVEAADHQLAQPLATRWPRDPPASSTGVMLQLWACAAEANVRNREKLASQARKYEAKIRQLEQELERERSEKFAWQLAVWDTEARRCEVLQALAEANSKLYDAHLGRGSQGSAEMAQLSRMEQEVNLMRREIELAREKAAPVCEAPPRVQHAFSFFLRRCRPTGVRGTGTLWRL